MKLSYKWVEAPPSIPKEYILSNKYAEIIIVGAGHAGSCTARAAAETGASVIVLEQQSKEKQWILGVGEIGHISSKWQEQQGVPHVDIVTFVNDWQMRTANRSNYRLIKEYAESALIGSLNH